MKKYFECNDTDCMAHNGCNCMWSYEDNIDKNNKRVCQHIRDLLKRSVMRDFEHTPEEMAKKLMEFNRDFLDDEEEIKHEIEYVAELFEKLQKSEEFNALAHHLDIMFMDDVFK